MRVDRDERLEEVIYFLIDMTTRSMRKHSHQVLKEAGFDITIDQFVVLKILDERNVLTQREIAEMLYKDNASITRIIELLVKKEIVTRKISKTDRRTFHLELTEKGKEYVDKAKVIVYELRQKGIAGVSEKDLEITKQTLKKMTGEFL